MFLIPKYNQFQTLWPQTEIPFTINVLAYLAVFTMSCPSRATVDSTTAHLQLKSRYRKTEDYVDSRWQSLTAAWPFIFALTLRQEC